MELAALGHDVDNVRAAQCPLPSPMPNAFDDAVPCREGKARVACELMSVTIIIPDDFADVLGATVEERAQRAREAIALELYREGKISLRRMGELAGLGGDHWAADRLRVRHRVPINYALDDLDTDRLGASRLNEG